jgi:hypothetical protein
LLNSFVSFESSNYTKIAKKLRKLSRRLNSSNSSKKNYRKERIVWKAQTLWLEITPVPTYSLSLQISFSRLRKPMDNRSTLKIRFNRQQSKKIILMKSSCRKPWRTNPK